MAWEVVAKAVEPLPFYAPLLEDESAIPVRQWVGGEGAFPKARLAAISGAPGVHKTTFALNVCCALAAGIPYAGVVNPDQPTRVLFATIEDDIEELWRRAHAFCARHADAPHLRRKILENLILIDLADHVPLYTIDSDSGRLVKTEGAQRFEASIELARPELAVVDPYLELHTAEEGSNTLMRPVNRQLRLTATKWGCTIVILQHDTKAGEGTPLQRMRGAGAIGGSIRHLLSLRHMTEDEAKEFGIDPENRDLYMKVESGKEQYSRKAKPRWFVAEERPLANGDKAHFLDPWSPPRVEVDLTTIVNALGSLRSGIDGEPCSESNRSSACYRRAFEAAGIPKSIHSTALDRLKDRGDAALKAWRDPHGRKVHKRLWVDGNCLEGWI